MIKKTFRAHEYFLLLQTDVPNIFPHFGLGADTKKICNWSEAIMAKTRELVFTSTFIPDEDGMLQALLILKSFNSACEPDPPENDDAFDGNPSPQPLIH